MVEKKIIAVVGATGNQGGSVVSLWASSPDLQSKYSIRAITRDSSKASAKALAKSGAEVVTADLGHPETLESAFKGAYAVFGVTNFQEAMDAAKEKTEGLALANAAFKAGVKHIIFSSLPHTTKLTNGKLPNIDHFTSKAEVEEYIEANKSSHGAIATYYQPGFFNVNLKNGWINPGPDGKPTLAAPHGKDSWYPLIDIAADTGKYVWGIIEAGQTADGKQVQAVSDWKTAGELVDALNKYAQAGEVQFVQVPRDVFKGFLTQKMGETLGEEFTQNMELIGEYSYYGKGAEKKQAENDQFLLKGKKKVPFEEWVQQNAPLKFGGQ